MLNEQAGKEEQLAKRQAAAKRRAARQRASRLEAALREVERLQRERVHDRKNFVARASSTDSEAHVMRNGEGGTVPSYNVQLITDTQHGLVVNVEATTDAIDYRQLDSALERCEQKLGRAPQQVVADGDYTNHASVQAAATHGVDFYGSWQDSWKATERDAQGRSAVFLSSAFPLRCGTGCFPLPGRRNAAPSHGAESRTRRAHAHVSRAKGVLPKLSATQFVRSAKGASRLETLDHAYRRTSSDNGLQGQNENGRSPANLRATLADRGVSTRVD